MQSRARQTAYNRIWISLARAYVQAGKLRQAQSTLEELGLTRAVRDKLREDPGFAPLRDHPRYGRILE